MYGGCECWIDEMCDVDDMVPVGCDRCGEDAANACGIDWEDTSMDDDEHGNPLTIINKKFLHPLHSINIFYQAFFWGYGQAFFD